MMTHSQFGLFDAIGYANPAPMPCINRITMTIVTMFGIIRVSLRFAPFSRIYPHFGKNIPVETSSPLVSSKLWNQKTIKSIWSLHVSTLILEEQSRQLYRTLA